MTRNSLKLKGRTTHMSHPNLNYQSNWQLNHLNPDARTRSNRNLRSQTSVHLRMSAQRLHVNRHVATAHKLVDNISDEESFDSRLKNILNHYNFQLALVVLIILDCLMVLGEMIIELQLLSASTCLESIGQNGQTGHAVAETATEASGHFISSRSIPEAHGGHGDGHHGGMSHYHHMLEHLEHYFHITSICILFLFNMDFVVRFYAFTWRYFLHWEVTLDFFIVFISFWLDVAFLLDKSLKNLFFLLVTLRMWRVLRILHAVATAVKAPFERQVEKLKKKRKILQRDLAKAYFYSNMLEDEIRNLRRYVDNIEIIDDNEEETRGSKAEISKKDEDDEVNNIGNHAKTVRF